MEGVGGGAEEEEVEAAEEVMGGEAGEVGEERGGDVGEVGEGSWFWFGCLGGMTRDGALLGGGGIAFSPPLVVRVVTLLEKD